MIALAALLLLLTSSAHAHPLAPALLEVRELAGSVAEVTWKTPLLQPRGAQVAPVLPAGCRALADPDVRVDGEGVVQRWQVSCAGPWIGESIGMTGLAEAKTQAMGRVVLADGRVVTTLLTGERASFRIPARASRWEVGRDYVSLGLEHLLTGLDHLLFVLGLVLLITRRHALLATVTAFTVGHSITLSLAVLGLARIPAAPIEFGIAASILVLATEVAAPRPSGLVSRHPWAMALGFGLLHGLGFAGALTAIGLPRDEVPLALFFFNVGIELGQLLFVGAVLTAAALLGPRVSSRPAWTRAVPAYVMSLAAFWCLERLAPIVGSLGSLS
jgi:hydrogenase/urease accessory protein HupE